MALPYVQLDSDFIKRKAATIAAILKVPRQLVVGMGSDLFDYIVEETATETEPPSGVMLDPDAADIFEGVMEWRGPPGTAFDAFVRAGVVEKLEIGARVKGCERYRATWLKNRRRKPDGNRTVTAPEPDETGPERKRKRKMEMKRKLLPTEEAVAPPAAHPLVYEAPPEGQDPETWVDRDFFRWSQAQRIRNGLMGEKWPRAEKLSAFWRNAKLSRISTRRLMDAYFAFGSDPYWEKATPPHPFQAFMAGFEKYVPQEAA